MNYFTFGNFDSRNHDKIVVESLPPISSSPIRYTQIQIDGRDGDVIERNGRAAYEKNVVFGTTPGVDIDLILSQLNGSGNLVLSNEPDKYYKAEVLDAVVFEKYGRFKKCACKFHTQPYKYALQSTELTYSGVEVSATNMGSASALPIITMVGNSAAALYINGNEVFSYNFQTANDSVVIDSVTMNAYSGDVNKNEYMSGYFPEIPPGAFTIGFSSGVESATITYESRWV